MSVTDNDNFDDSNLDDDNNFDDDNNLDADDAYYDSQLSWLIKIFYPSSDSTHPEPSTTVACLTDYAKQSSYTSAALASFLTPVLLHTARNSPANIDYVLQTIKLLLLNSPSLPLITIWRPKAATFEDMFNASLREDLDGAISGPIELSRRDSYIAASFLVGRVGSIAVCETRGWSSLAEGLGFPDSCYHDYEGEQAEIAAIGSCLQLLGGASAYMRDFPLRFTKDNILAALDGLPSTALIEFTKHHMQKEPLEDLTSEKFNTLMSQGWPIPRSLRVRYRSAFSYLLTRPRVERVELLEEECRKRLACGGWIRACVINQYSTVNIETKQGSDETTLL